MLTVAAVVAAVTSTSAHRLDELLQAARIGIAEDRVDLELDLTPGTAMADRLIAEIDRDGDARFSSDEQRAFVDGVIGAIELSNDDTALQLSVASVTFPEPDALRTGNGSIAIRAEAPLVIGASGSHQLGFNNRYQRDGSVYLANALVPETNRIAVTAQLRDGAQSELTIEYRVRDTRSAALPFAVVAAVIAAIGALARKSLLG